MRKLSGGWQGTPDLPMGRHDAEAVQDPKLFEAFKHFVKIEEELLHLLEMRVDQNRKVLIEMGQGRWLITNEGK